MPSTRAAVMATAISMVVALAHADMFPNTLEEWMRPVTVEELQQNATLLRKARSTANIGQLTGTYVAECQDAASSWFNDHDLANLSSAKTTEYTDLNTEVDKFEVDYTEYVSRDCTVGADENQVFSKFNIYGDVYFNGVSKLLKGVYQATWHVNRSTFIFPLSKNINIRKRVAQTIGELREKCPCKGEWVAGKPMTFHRGQCGLKLGEPYPFLCHIADGTIMYATYKMLNDGREGYQSSAVQYDKARGWSQEPTSVPRYKLPEGGVIDPDDCNPLRWNVCQDPVEDSANYCQGCTGLECVGCMYRVQEEDVKNPQFWSECCPCDYSYALHPSGKYSLNWMKVNC